MRESQRERNTKMKRLYLSKENRKIFGLCGGIGDTYNIDPAMVRLVVFFLFLATAVIPVLITYIAARLFLPEKTAE